MSIPSVINDGNWNTIAGGEMAGDYQFPFAGRGETNPAFKAVLKYRQDKSAYLPRPIMSTFLQFTLGRGYLTKLGNPRDVGCGVFEYEDTFSSLPETRYEPGSFPYTRQWWKAIADVDVDPSKYFYTVNYDVEEQTFTVKARVVYEYFLNSEPAPLIKPRVFLLFGILNSIGGTPPETDPSGNTFIVAEDSQVTIYEGRIYERRTIQVQIYTETPVT